MGEGGDGRGRPVRTTLTSTVWVGEWVSEWEIISLRMLGVCVGAEAGPPGVPPVEEGWEAGLGLEVLPPPGWVEFEEDACELAPSVALGGEANTTVLR